MSFPPFDDAEYKAAILALKALYDKEVTAGRRDALTDAQFQKWSGLQAFADLVGQKYYDGKTVYVPTP